MPTSIFSSPLQRLRLKNEDRNLISATFHMISITLISMSLTDLTWFSISGGGIPDLSLSEFFYPTCSTSEERNCISENILNGTIISMMRMTICLCFMAIVFSLCGFLLDLIGSRKIAYRMLRKYAVAGACTVLWIMLIVGVSYYIILLLEDSIKSRPDVTPQIVCYGSGFYVLASAGGISLIGIFYNLIIVHHPVHYYREDDTCLIGFDDGFDTFNSPTPPPPYNIPPPPYTP